MIIQNLSNTSFDDLMNCFFIAFENYYVKMPTDRSYYNERWKAAKVDFSLSYGMFDDGKLIGFLIHGIDDRNGNLTAFNTGTGVLPEYRGKRIVNSIYEFALKDLYSNGIKKVKLEVITENKIAIRSYRTLGFEICKKFKCFKGNLKSKKVESIELIKLNSNEINWSKLPNQELYSWDNQKESLLNGGEYTFFQIVNNKVVESFFIIKQESGYLAQFDTLYSNNNDLWKRLFSGIIEISDSIKINNVDERCKEKCKQLIAVGLENFVDQYEMELSIENLN